MNKPTNPADIRSLILSRLPKALMDALADVEVNGDAFSSWGALALDDDDLVRWREYEALPVEDEGHPADACCDDEDWRPEFDEHSALWVRA